MGEIMNSLVNCSTLEEFEVVLTKMFEKVSIINELTIGKFAYKRLENLISSKLMNSSKQVDLINILWKKYPYSCMSLTVFIAIYKYDGNYWARFKKATHCNDDQRWKEWFLYYIKMKGLPVFDEKGTQKYVSTILGHAGVPNRSINGFVQGLIQPAINFGLDAEEAITDLQDFEQKQINSTYLLHKGVRDYLLSGGKVAVDFVDRCIQVVQENERPFIEKYKGILPRRVLKGIEETLIEGYEGKITKSEKIISPIMKLDPYLEGVYMSIPIQKVSISWVERNSNWRIIKKDELIETIPCDIVLLANSKQHELIPKINKLKLNPYETYRLELEVDGKIIRQWKADTRGAMLFDADSKKNLNRTLLHSGLYWILIRKEFSLSSETEELHDLTSTALYDEWSNYVLYEISPQKNQKVIFENNEQIIEFEVFTKIDKPRFLEEKDTIWGGEVPSFFKVPTLCIPVSTYPNIRNELKKWQLKIYHSQSNSMIEKPLVELENHIKMVGKYFEIKLSEIEIGIHAGKHELRVVGPLGYDIRLSFIKLPSLLIVNDIVRPELPPSKAGYIYREYEINVDSSYIITCLWPNDSEFYHLKSGENYNKYKLKVPVTVSKLKMQMTNITTSESFEVDLITKLLSWDIYRNQEVTIQSNNMLSVSEYDVENNDYRILLNTEYLKHQSNRNYLTAIISLRNNKGKVIQKQIKKVRIGSQIPIVVKHFKDTIIQHASSQFTIWLEFDSFLTTPISLISVTKYWTINNVIINLSDNALRLTWNENIAVENRIIRIWNESQPWKGYQEISIEESNNQTSVPWVGMAEGNYLFEWATATEDNDIFSFLEEVKYPKSDSANTFRWSYSDSLNTQVNKLAEQLLNGKNNRKKVDILHSDLEEILNGILLFGENYVDFLKENHFAWYDVIHLQKKQILESLNSIMMDENKIKLIRNLFGVQEWTSEEISQLPDEIISEVICKVDRSKLQVGDFGQTLGMYSTMIKKTVEDCHIVSQLIPFIDVLIKDFSIQHELIQYLIKRNSNLEYHKKIKAFLNKHRIQLLDLYDWLMDRSIITPDIKDLLNTRWENIDNPIDINFPFLVAVTALGSRLLARNIDSIPVSYKRTIRSASNDLISFHPSWFLFDCAFIEVKLQNKLKGEILQ